MPDWDAVKKAYINGDLTPAERSAFETSWSLGKVPGTGESAAKARNRKNVERILRSNPVSMSEEEKSAMMGSWLEDNGQLPNGVGYFTDDPNGVSGDTMMKMFQNIFNENKHKDILTEYQKYMALDDEQKAEKLPFFTKENMVVEASELFSSHFTGLGGEFGKKRRTKARIEAEESRLLKDDFMAMRSMYESRIVSDIGRKFSKTVADTGIFDPNVFARIPQEEKKLIPGYIQVIKPKAEHGLLTEAGVRFSQGVKDITLGSIEYVGKKAAIAGLSLAEQSRLEGSSAARDMLNALDELEGDQLAEQQALAIKFEERDFKGKAVTGIAGSLPLMASFFITGPNGSLGTTGKLGKIATQYNKLVKHYPVAMATLSMANDHEQLMISQGVSRQTAQPIALGTSIANMYVEKMALDELLGVPKSRIFKVSNEFILKKFLADGGNFMFRASKGFSSELMEEVIQGFNEELMTQVGRNISTGKFDGKQILETTAETFVESMPSTLGFGLGGAAFGIVEDVRSPIIDDLDGYARDKAFRERIDDVMFDKEVSAQEKREGFNKIFNEWDKAKTEEDKRDVLVRNNVNNVDEAMGVMLEEKQDRELVLEQEAIRLREGQARLEAFQQEEMPKVQQEAREFARQFPGIDEVAFVESLSEAVDPDNVSLLKGRLIEVLESYEDPKQAVRQGVFHRVLEDLGLLTDQQKSILEGAVDKIVGQLKEAGLDVSIYDGMEGNKKVNEVLADAGAVLNPQEMSLWENLKELYEKVKNFFTGKGFQSARSILKSVEAQALDAEDIDIKDKGVHFAKRATRSANTFKDMAEFNAASWQRR
jgi:hypothetical protein